MYRPYTLTPCSNPRLAGLKSCITIVIVGGLYLKAPRHEVEVARRNNND